MNHQLRLLDYQRALAALKNCSGLSWRSYGAPTPNPVPAIAQYFRDRYQWWSTWTQSAREAGGWLALAYLMNIRADLAEWLLEQSEDSDLHPVFGYTDAERRDVITGRLERIIQRMAREN